MAHLSRSQLLGYAVIAVAVLVLGGRWLAGRATESGQTGWTTARPGPAWVADGEGSSDDGEGGAPGDQAEPGDVRGPRISSPAGAAFVHVVGAVRRPGVYRLGGRARVRDALNRAGGATRRADVSAINLAAVVQDGVQIVVPRRGATGAAAPAAGAAMGAAGETGAPAAPVNLNTATAEQLETLDGVGPATAAKILDYRRTHGGFRSVDDLDQVSGIGPKRLAALRDKVTV